MERAALRDRTGLCRAAGRLHRGARPQAARDAGLRRLFAQAAAREHGLRAGGGRRAAALRFRARHPRRLVDALRVEAPGRRRAQGLRREPHGGIGAGGTAHRAGERACAARLLLPVGAGQLFARANQDRGQPRRQLARGAGQRHGDQHHRQHARERGRQRAVQRAGDLQLPHRAAHRRLRARRVRRQPATGRGAGGPGRLPAAAAGGHLPHAGRQRGGSGDPGGLAAPADRHDARDRRDRHPVGRPAAAAAEGRLCLASRPGGAGERPCAGEPAAAAARKAVRAEPAECRMWSCRNPSSWPRWRCRASCR